MYTLAEAAKAVGLGKPAILKNIQKGRISAQKDVFGHWQVDPAELHRVYPIDSSPAVSTETNEIMGTDVETGILNAKLEAALEVKAMLERENADLRRRLDDEQEQARQREAWLKEQLENATKLLPGAAEKKGFWARLFGK